MRSGENSWSPRRRKKKTSIGQGKNTKFKNKGSLGGGASNGHRKTKGYRKQYRGQGKR